MSFCNIPFNDRINQEHQTITKYIDGMEDSSVVNVDLNELKSELVIRFTLDQIKFDLDNLVCEREECKVEEHYLAYYPSHTFTQTKRTRLVEGIRVNYEIPILSGKDMFSYHGQAFSRVSDDFYIKRDSRVGYKLTFNIEISISELDKHDRPDEFINKLYDDKTKALFFSITHLNNQIKAYNNSLLKFISDLVDKKNQQTQKKINVLSKITIPIKNKVNNSENLEKVKIKVEKTIEEKHETKENQSEYEISDDDYNQIVRSMTDYLDQLENYYPLIQKIKNEEDIRSLIIAHLTATFKIDVSGESFRGNGKTDICIIKDSKAAFITECKKWKGQSYLYEAIDQIYNYSTWKDRKVAILLFNLDNKKFSDLIDSLGNSIKNHKNFISVSSHKGNTWKCEFQSKHSTSKNLKITFVISNFHGK